MMPNAAPIIVMQCSGDADHSRPLLCWNRELDQHDIVTLNDDPDD